MANLEQKVALVQKINDTPPVQLATIPEVADRFKKLYRIMNGGNVERADVKYEAEKFHFMNILTDSKDLKLCTKLSLYGCFLDMAVNGLSFDPSMKHGYLVPFDVNVGTKDNPRYEKRAKLMVSGYGELSMRMRQGQIKYADNPVLVFDGDLFKYGTKENKIYVSHEAVFPRQSETVIACYIRIERADGSVDYKVFGVEEVLKLKNFSKQKNSLAWTTGINGMIENKTIKHAFRSYPKVKMGEFSALQSQTIDTEPEEMPSIDYGLDDTTQLIEQGPGAIQTQQVRPMHHETAAGLVLRHDNATHNKGNLAGQGGPLFLNTQGSDTIDDDSFAKGNAEQPAGLTVDADDF